LVSDAPAQQIGNFELDVDLRRVEESVRIAPGKAILFLAA
jgi:hypothetical protein